MKPLAILGLLLALAGGYLLANGGNFAIRKDVVKIGDVKITAPEEHSLPTRASAALLLGGLGLMGGSGCGAGAAGG
ncbi:MAG: hypothetical protein IPF77_13180 [Gemmatimonadetes bacterium]|nr:hypothetical protein [Gemmatimonadota bacterium]